MTGTLIVCSHCVYYFIDPRYTMSYVISFIAVKLCKVAESLDKPFIVSRTVGESFIAKRVYRGCSIEIDNRRAL